MKKLSTVKFVASLVTLAACGAIVVGTTYSLFTNEKDVKTHLVISGNLQAELYLKELKQDVLDEHGLIKSQTVDLSTLKDSNGKNLVVDEEKGVSLLNYTDKIFDGVKLVPGMEGKATFLLYNTGEVAFDYMIDKTIVAYDKSGKIDENAAIKDQIEWSIVAPEEKRVLKSQYDEISVSYKFIDDDKNNDAQEQSMDLDLTFKLSSVTK